MNENSPKEPKKSHEEIVDIYHLDVVAMACRGDCSVEFDDLQILEVGSQKPSLG